MYVCMYVYVCVCVRACVCATSGWKPVSRGLMKDVATSNVTYLAPL